LSVSELLHYGASNAVEFFVQVPKTVLVVDIHQSLIPATAFYPPCLTLQHTDCLELDLDHNATIYQSEFVAAYGLTYPDLLYYPHAMSWAEGRMHPGPNWRTYVDGEVQAIPISIKLLFVTRPKLYQLVQLLKEEERVRVAPVKQSVSESSFNRAEHLDARNFFQLKDEGQNSVGSEKTMNAASFGDEKDAESSKIKSNQPLDSQVVSNNSTGHNPTDPNTAGELILPQNLAQCIDHKVSDKSNVQQQKKIFESAFEMTGFYSMKEMMALIGMGRSTINEKINPAHARYDSAFPKKCIISGRKIGFKKEKVHEWINSR
jgi:predicted DNA-binding transcriptional regulator AlpA